MKKYDVAVCGGGFAGISAALAAAREGKKVILFEKQYMLGGLGTAGLVTVYLPLCDGFGHQVSFGIAEELLKLSITYGAEDKYPENWLDNIGTRTEKDKRYEVQYNAQLFAILAYKIYNKYDYRNTINNLSVSDKLQKALKLKTIPHYTTIQKFFKKLSVEKLKEINTLLLQHFPVSECYFSLDGTGFTNSYSDLYYNNRTKKNTT